MKKNFQKRILICFIFLVSISFIVGGSFLYRYLRIKNAKIEVSLVEDLTIPFGETKKVSDFITSINGTILEDYLIDSSSLGKKDISFKFINDDNIKVSYNYQVEITDVTKPVIWLGSSYTITKGNAFHPENILCGDDLDNEPNCYVEGEYDTDKVGMYPLTFIAIDKSGNRTEQAFKLNVTEPKKNTTPNTNTEPSYTEFQDVVKKFKNDKTRIGIDVSSWQGEIDFDALQNAGVEFVIIRVGGTRGRDKEYFVDNNFVYNITEANKRNMDVGIYFYSYASSSEKAKEEANWVLEQIKDYKVNLPIAYDWENWSTFNEYHLSFFGLTSMAETFLDTIHNAGYDGLLYSSKNYLEKLWMPSKYETWLAHYVDKTTYQGTYRFWQHCNDGRVDGIKGAVDIDVMYME